MTSVPFATSSGLPMAPKGTRLLRVSYRTCPGSDVCVQVLRDVDASLDAHGVPKDAWWAVKCAKLPDRTMRLFEGSHSLSQLLKRYGFLDGEGCVSHKQAVAEFGPATPSKLPPLEPIGVPKHLQDARGVPQFHPNSGVCWFGTLCWTSFANPKVRDLLLSKMPTDLAKVAKDSIYSKEAAKAFRHKLWFEYAVGDDVTQDPSLDGRNGFTEFSVLCAKLGVPMVRYREHNDKLVLLDPSLTDRKGRRTALHQPKRVKNGWEPHLLVLRYQDGDHHKHPIRRRVVHAGQRYRLVGLYLGQRHCGHQIGAAFPNDSWRQVSWGDSDLHKAGIGPIHVDFQGPEWVDGWWTGMREITHLTKFGTGYHNICNMNAWNDADDKYDAYRSSGRGKRHRPGSLSIDVVYLTCETC